MTTKSDDTDDRARDSAPDAPDAGLAAADRRELERAREGAQAVISAEVLAGEPRRGGRRPGIEAPVRPICAVLAVGLLGLACREPTLGPPSVDEALRGLPRDRPIAARLVTDLGVVHCALRPAHAPHAVALFVGLATGRARWRDPGSRAVTSRPLYRNISFFRALPGAYVQSGCPLGNGTGHPGYRIRVEPHTFDAVLLSLPGALVLAHYQAPPNRRDPDPPPPGHVLGSQFAITLGDMHHLAGTVSVLGTCEDVDVVRGIASAVASARETRNVGPQLRRIEIAGR